MSTRRENMYMPVPNMWTVLHKCKHKCTYFLFIFQTSSVFRMEPQPQFTAHKAHSLWKSSTTGTLVHVTFAAQRSLPRNFSLQEIGNQKTHTYRYCTNGNLKRRRCSVKCRFTKQKDWIFFFSLTGAFCCSWKTVPRAEHVWNGPQQPLLTSSTVCFCSFFF